MTRIAQIKQHLSAIQLPFDVTLDISSSRGMLSVRARRGALRLFRIVEPIENFGPESRLARRIELIIEWIEVNAGRYRFA